jgi:hypothetical protein
MSCRNQTEDRAEALFETIKPELLSLLRNAPQFGSCGVDVFFHQGEIIRTSVRAEITRKLQIRAGGHNGN